MSLLTALGSAASMRRRLTISSQETGARLHANDFMWRGLFCGGKEKEVWVPTCGPSQHRNPDTAIGPI